MSFLKIENLEKRYGKTLALADFSLGVKKGEIVGILGPSGCGKTTLLRLLSGLEVPDKGSIILDGKILSNRKHFVPPEKRNIALVFQDLALWPHMKVKDHLKFVLESRNSKNISKEISYYLELGDLSEFKNRYPNQLSGGQQQRVALLRSLAQKPKLLLLDEPLANLDPILKENLKNKFLELHKELNPTIIYVTHDNSELQNFANRIAIMNKGKLLQFGTITEIKNNSENELVRKLLSL